MSAVPTRCQHDIPSLHCERGCLPPPEWHRREPVTHEVAAKVIAEALHDTGGCCEYGYSGCVDPTLLNGYARAVVREWIFQREEPS